MIHLASHHTGAGATVTVSGWGFLRTGANVPNQLQSLDKRAIANDDCARRLGFPAFVPAAKICAEAAANQGVCQGGMLINNYFLYLSP
jgi:hypothetical protein